MKYDLDKHEKEILEDFEKGEFVSVDHLKKEFKLAQSAAKNFMTNQIKQLAEKLSEQLKLQQLKLVTAESCTGGGLSYWLTSIAGSSAWFERGFVTYSNLAKMECLGVSEKTLQTFGSVSEKTALEMAEGALKNSDADVSVAITGIAGPDGGTKEKPVGTVWIAVGGTNQHTVAKHFLFSGDRLQIRESTIEEALALLLSFIDSK